MKCPDCGADMEKAIGNNKVWTCPGCGTKGVTGVEEKRSW